MVANLIYGACCSIIEKGCSKVIRIMGVDNSFADCIAYDDSVSDTDIVKGFNVYQ